MWSLFAGVVIHFVGLQHLIKEINKSTIKFQIAMGKNLGGRMQKQLQLDLRGDVWLIEFDCFCALYWHD